MLYLPLTLIIAYFANAQYTYKDFYKVDNVSEVENYPITAVFSDSKDMGQCTCDLGVGICDYHCCCDNDCDTALIQNWKDQSKCIDKHDTQREDYKCMNDKNTYNYNIKEAGLKYRDQIESLLCVKFDNGKDMGEFYEVIDPGNARWNTELRDRYTQWVDEHFPIETSESTTNSGDPIKDSDNNYMYLFEADSNGRCVLTNKIRYNTDMTSSCGINTNTNSQTLSTTLQSLLSLGANNIQTSIDSLGDNECFTSVTITFYLLDGTIDNVEIQTNKKTKGSSSFKRI